MLEMSLSFFCALPLHSRPPTRNCGDPFSEFLNNGKSLQVEASLVRVVGLHGAGLHAAPVGLGLLLSTSLDPYGRQRSKSMQQQAPIASLLWQRPLGKHGYNATTVPIVGA